MSITKPEFVDKLKMTNVEIFERDVRDFIKNPRDEVDAFLVEALNNSPQSGMMVSAGLSTPETMIDSMIRMKSHQWVGLDESDRLTPEALFGFVLCEYVLRQYVSGPVKINCHGFPCIIDDGHLLYVQEQSFKDSDLPELTLKQLVEDAQR